MVTKKALKEYIRQLKNNPYNVRNIPFDKLNVEECLALVQVSGVCLKYVPENKRTKKVCEAAFLNDVMALQYIPERFKTREMCTVGYSKTISLFPYLLKELYTLELCIDCYRRRLNNERVSISLKQIACIIPKSFHEVKEIFDLERKLGVVKIKEKKYQDEKFIVVEELLYEEALKVSSFESFDEFYHYVDGNLSGAELLEFDFENINFENIDISDAYIRTDVLVAKGVYSDTYYKTNIKAPKECIELVQYEPQEMIIINHDLNDSLSNDIRRVYYISDLHLNHKLKLEFPSCATEMDVKHYIKDMVEGLVSSRGEIKFDDFLLIAGDVSFNYKIAELFYTELAKQWVFSNHIIVVLGNHELWNYGAKGKDKYEISSIIEKYKKLFAKLNICFLQNDLLIVTGDDWYNSEISIVTEKEIMANNIQWLSEKCLKSRFTVFGGIGFSGESSEFNALNGIYRNTIVSLEEDKKYTEEFASTYNKLKNAISNLRVVVLTHMPIEDWSREGTVSNWIYVNGHTHRNYFEINENGEIYADNQVGYYTKCMGLKCFSLSMCYDVFKDFADGIYVISREDYINFNRGVKVNITFNRIEGNIIMLKREGLYCFFYKKNNEKLYLLKGGSVRKIKHQDIQYYFETMVIYKKAMESIMHGYHQTLKYISNEVKKIGGDGRIHGNIVDIDYYNHIYFNPFTGELKGYWAESISYRKEYPTVVALLKNERADLYVKYLENKYDLQFFSGEVLAYESEAVAIIGDTSIYTSSNMFRSLQYMFDVNVIREWNEEMVERAVNKYLGTLPKIE